jgi:hypothetical protein
MTRPPLTKMSPALSASIAITNTGMSPAFHLSNYVRESNRLAIPLQLGDYPLLSGNHRTPVLRPSTGAWRIATAFVA